MKKYSARITQGMQGYYRCVVDEVEANSIEEAKAIILEEYEAGEYDDFTKIEPEHAISADMINGTLYRKCLEKVLALVVRQENHKIIDLIETCFDEAVEDDIKIHDLKEEK